MDAHRKWVELQALGSIGLACGQIARIENARGVRLRVEAGPVWITEEGGGEDVCLKAGALYRVRNHGATLVSTLRAPFALISLEPALPVPPTLAPMTHVHFSREELKALRSRATNERAGYLAGLFNRALRALRT